MRDIELFVEALRTIRTPKGLEQLLSDAAREAGFDMVTMFQHVDLSPCRSASGQGTELICINTAPVGWSEHYRDHNLVTLDPRVLACGRTVSPFLADEAGRLVHVTSAQRDVVERLKRANIGDSFIVPIHVPGEPSGSCTFAMTSGRQLPTANLAMAHLIGVFAFEAARRMMMRMRGAAEDVGLPDLTDRQLQCAVLVGRGFSEAEIAMRLGISSETVKRHLKEARRSFGVNKSVQLVTRLLRDGRITLRDLCRRHGRLN